MVTVVGKKDLQLRYCIVRTGKRPDTASKAVQHSPKSSQSSLPSTRLITMAIPVAPAGASAASPVLPDDKDAPHRQLSLALPLSKAASAPVMLSRTSSQTRSRPSGLPLARKGSSAGFKAPGKLPAGQGRSSELSVTEMMQWLDSKLAQAKPARVVSHQSPAR